MMLIIFKPLFLGASVDRYSNGTRDLHDLVVGRQLGTKLPNHDAMLVVTHVACKEQLWVQIWGHTSMPPRIARRLLQESPS